MRILLLSSHLHYLQATLPLSWTLRRYWPSHPPVHVLCYEPPSFSPPPDFTYHVMGTPDQYPITRWSDGVSAFLRLMQQVDTDGDPDLGLLMLDDMWLTAPVNANALQVAWNYCVQFRYVARFDLTGDRLHSGFASHYGYVGDYRLIISSPDSGYHLSTMPAIWRLSHLQSVLVPGETPWDLEIFGTPRLARLRDKCIVLGYDCWPLRNTLAFRGGDTGKLLLGELDEKDVADMRREGLLEGLE